jgi:hypothetical protein
MNVERNRFVAGFVVFIFGIVWNVHYSLVSWQTWGAGYGRELRIGGLIAALGLTIMVTARRGNGQWPSRRK